MKRLEQITSILVANKSRWLGETEIVRAVYPDRRDSQISDVEWQAVISGLREIKARSKNIGWNEIVWRA